MDIQRVYTADEVDSLIAKLRQEFIQSKQVDPAWKAGVLPSLGEIKRMTAQLFENFHNPVKGRPTVLLLLDVYPKQGQKTRYQFPLHRPDRAAGRKLLKPMWDDVLNIDPTCENLQYAGRRPPHDLAFISQNGILLLKIQDKYAGFAYGKPRADDAAANSYVMRWTWPDPFRDLDSNSK